MKTFLKFAIVLVFATALFYWREVWAWVSAKTWEELSGDILGFILKWFFLAVFAFIAANVPHYIEPWLKLARMQGRKRLQASRRRRNPRAAMETGHPMPRVNKDRLLLALAGELADKNQRRGGRDE